MNTELMDLGFAFKKSQLWKTVYEEELFAIHLPPHLTLADGSEYIYCTVMGRNGEHRALAAYLGKRGFNSLRTIHQQLDEDDLESLLSQDCVQCSLETAEQFPPEDLKLIMEETRKRKLRPPYPQFSRYRPCCVPWHITDPKDAEILTIALRITVALSDFLKCHDKKDIPLERVRIQRTRDMAGDQLMMSFVLQDIELYEKAQRIPVLSLREEKLTVDEMIPLPEPSDPDYPKAVMFDELKLRSLKKIPKKGIIESQVVRIPKPTKEESDDSAPYLPAVLLSVDEDGMMRLPVMMRQAEYDPNEAVNDLMKGMLAEKLRPEEIHVRTEETFSLLECFCQKAGIRLIRDEDLDLLDEAKETMLDRFADAEEEEDDFGPDDLIEMLESMSEKEFLSMPGFMIDQIESMVESGMLPESLAGRMRQLLKRYRR